MSPFSHIGIDGTDPKAETAARIKCITPQFDNIPSVFHSFIGKVIKSKFSADRSAEMLAESWEYMEYYPQDLSPVEFFKYQPDNLYIQIAARQEYKRAKSFVSIGLSFHTEKAKKYSDFAKRFYDTFAHLCNLFSIITIEPQYDSFFKARLKGGTLDIEHLTILLRQLFKEADDLVIKKLLWWYLPLKDDDAENRRLMELSFPWELYKNPISMKFLPEEKKEFLLLFRGLLGAEIEKRKEALQIGKLPWEYQLIEDYAISLLESFSPEKPPIQAAGGTVRSPLQLRYSFANYIFTIPEAQYLFEKWIEHYQQPVQVSLIFRMMSEKENPPLIVAKDTPFRNWYNGLPDVRPLQNHTHIYDRCQNDDRVAAYHMLKSSLSIGRNLNE